MKALFPRRDGLPPAALLIALLALPQAAETILAPALPTWPATGGWTRP